MQYAFFLDRGDRNRAPKAKAPSPLVRLALRASLVVTDFFPTFIVPRQTKRLREKLVALGSSTPVVAVDSCTVVPLSSHGREYGSARAIRPILMEALPHFLHPVGDVAPRIRRQVDVGFDATVLSQPPSARPPVTLSALIASCPIDHSVPPSRTIRGGSVAARERLEQFLETGLRHYTELRGDPNEDVTSRLSPYLHFGNISPQEVLLRTRDVAPAAEFQKFLDELLTWRELAYNFCYFNSRHRTVVAIPAWARTELDDHADDPRPALYSAAQFERADTGDELWNAAQRAYLRDGFMPNYLRMLWGKSVLLWTRHYSNALHLLEHLNNKYALDGRDPASYGGIHWIFGKFDRPFYRRPVFGTVRYMSLKAARDKFDADAYIRRYAS